MRPTIDCTKRRVSEAEDEERKAWAKHFPVNELVKRKAIAGPAGDGEQASHLLAFFGVATVATWHARYSARNIAYRHSPAFESDPFALQTWLRLAEVKAGKQNVLDYNERGFKEALARVRALTRKDVPGAIKEAARLCNESGVALALVKRLPRMRLSGAAWWLSPRRPAIALSARHKTDDHLWFSFFHEAAHILLHGKKTVFVDDADGLDDDTEAEANNWASNFLLPRKSWGRFLGGGTFSGNRVRLFAQQEGVAPGIVVGRLQHERRLPWRSPLNSLKVKLQWADEQP